MDIIFQMNVPTCIWREIFKHLEWRDLGRVKCVSKRFWKEILSDNHCKRIMENHRGILIIPWETQLDVNNVWSMVFKRDNILVDTYLDLFHCLTEKIAN